VLRPYKSKRNQERPAPQQHPGRKHHASEGRALQKQEKPKSTVRSDCATRTKGVHLKRRTQETMLSVPHMIVVFLVVLVVLDPEAAGAGA